MISRISPSYFYFQNSLSLTIMNSVLRFSIANMSHFAGSQFHLNKCIRHRNNCHSHSVDFEGHVTPVVIQKTPFFFPDQFHLVNVISSICTLTTRIFQTVFASCYPYITLAIPTKDCCAQLIKITVKILLITYCSCSSHCIVVMQ